MDAKGVRRRCWWVDGAFGVYVGYSGRSNREFRALPLSVTLGMNTRYFEFFGKKGG